MARSMGMACYVLAGMMLAAALVVPVVGLIAVLVVSAWAAAASGMTFTGELHDPAGAVVELIVRGVIGLLRALGPLPAIVIVLLTVVVEAGLVVSAVILILIGRRLRRRPRLPLAAPAPRYLGR